jgi:pimeloyl-ACP methyl ester carboxylesterase
MSLEASMSKSTFLPFFCHAGFALAAALTLISCTPSHHSVLSEDELRSFDVLSRTGVRGTESDYHGFRCYDFCFEGRPARIAVPKTTASGVPWIWRARFWGHEPQTEIALLERGFHVVFCDVSESFCNDEALGTWNRFYLMLVGAGFAPRSALIGFSRGGVYAYRWAVRYPERVACVYADAPVLDLKSWPGGKGRGHGNPEIWETFKEDFKLNSEEEAMNWRGNPLDMAERIAATGIPLLHICGDADETVPIQENTVPFEKRVRATGGDIRVIMKPGIGHHPHSLVDPAPIVDFILKATGQDNHPTR